MNGTTIEKRVLPKLSGLNLPELKFPQFSDYKVIECPDFETSEEEEEEEEEVVNSVSILDRIRGKDGEIDLGIQKSNFGVITGKEVRNTRKMINYDILEEEKREDVSVGKLDLNEITFEFGDRGSKWRMIKLEKLGNQPSKEEILGQYATMWDYELACLEKEELESRRFKSRGEWVYKPSEEFLKSREGHIIANKIAMESLTRLKRDYLDIERDNDDSFIEMRKYNDVKISKNKKLKNELKLTHLMSMDNEFEDFTISREQIESLNND